MSDCFKSDWEHCWSREDEPFPFWTHQPSSHATTRKKIATLLTEILKMLIVMKCLESFRAPQGINPFILFSSCLNISFKVTSFVPPYWNLIIFVFSCVGFYKLFFDLWPSNVVVLKSCDIWQLPPLIKPPKTHFPDVWREVNLGSGLHLTERCWEEGDGGSWAGGRRFPRGSTVAALRDEALQS